MFDDAAMEYLLGYVLLDGILCDVGVGGADHEGDGDLAGGVILLPAMRIHQVGQFFLRAIYFDEFGAADMAALRDDGRVGDGRVGEQQGLELGRRHLHGTSQKRGRRRELEAVRACCVPGSP